MNLIKLPVATKDGREMLITVNRDSIQKVLKVPVPSEVNGPNGEPVNTMMTAVQIGMELMVLTCSEDALMMRLLDCNMKGLAEWREDNKWNDKELSLEDIEN